MNTLPSVCDSLWAPGRSPARFSAHGIFQARIREWVGISYDRGYFRPRDWTEVSFISCINRQILDYWRHLGSPYFPVKIAQLCPTLCDPTDSTVYGILQARILEWDSLLQGIFPTQRSNPGPPTLQTILYQLGQLGSPRILELGSLSPSPGEPPDPGIELGSPALLVDCLPAELAGKPFT